MEETGIVLLNRIKANSFSCHVNLMLLLCLYCFSLTFLFLLSCPVLSLQPRSCQFMSLCASAQLLVMQVPDWPTYRWLGMSICSSLTPVAVPPAGTMGSQSLLVPPVSASASPVTKERPVKRLLEEVRYVS